MEGSVQSRASRFSAPQEKGNTRVHDKVLVCNICLVPPTDPVVTFCGHLFCWPCLHQWLHQAQSKTCPFCRIELREDVSVTPIYGSPETGTSSAEGAILAGSIPKRPAPPFASSLESLENLYDAGPESSRFVFRSVALVEVKAWKEQCERLETFLNIHRGRLHALERQLNALNRGDRLERDQEARGSRSD